MWSPVQATPATPCSELEDDDNSRLGIDRRVSSADGTPTSRMKHAMCAAPDGYIYLMGGRSHNRSLKDLWRFDPGQTQWAEVICKGQQPPGLQEHTMVCWNNRLYIFGGDAGYDTPLWILDLATLTWRKHTAANSPSGRRGHTAVVYGDAMHVYGGYEDLRGSSSELWTFDFGKINVARLTVELLAI